MKHPNGFGSVYKLNGRRRKPWRATITTGWVGDGRRIRRTIGYFETKAQALDALALHRNDLIPARANISLEQLYTEWSAGKYEYINKSTVDSYKAGWKHLSKYGAVKFRELRAAQMQSVVDDCHKKGMSRSSLEKIRVVAVMLYDYAIQNDMAGKNYAKYIKLPKAEKEEKQVFNDLEMQKLEKSAGVVPWIDTVLILIYTGLRINELLGLTRFNIDLERQIITGGIKTDAGKNRIIPIHPKILTFIAAWLERSGERLICGEKGQALSDKAYRTKRYYPALEAACVRKLNPHCCRHTCASLLAKAGADTKAIQMILGHVSYAFTSDTYTHFNVEELRKAIGKI